MTHDAYNPDALEPHQTAVRVAPDFEPILDTQKRYVVTYSGRGSGKSWAIAIALVMRARMENDLRIMCARRYLVSMASSVHALLVDTIKRLQIEDEFDVQKLTITHKETGAQFMFCGLDAEGIDKVRSVERLGVLWIEEAQDVEAEAWKVIIPTVVRVRGCQIYISFNPCEESDYVYKRFIVDGDPHALVLWSRWDRNPFCSEEMRDEALRDYATDPDSAAWVWGGELRTVSDAQILGGKWEVKGFADDLYLKADRVLYGLDPAYGRDPAAAVRCFKIDNDLFVEYEGYVHGGDSGNLAPLLDGIPGARRGPWYCDDAAPDTIRQANKQRYPTRAAGKWAGMVDDKIRHFRAYSRIYVHPRCVNAIAEAKLWSWKKDKKGEIQTTPKPGWDHIWDSVSYALAGAGILVKDCANHHAMFLRQGEAVQAQAEQLATQADPTVTATVDELTVANVPLRPVPTSVRPMPAMLQEMAADGVMVTLKPINRAQPELGYRRDLLVSCAGAVPHKWAAKLQSQAPAILEYFWPEGNQMPSAADRRDAVDRLLRGDLDEHPVVEPSGSIMGAPAPSVFEIARLRAAYEAQERARAPAGAFPVSTEAPEARR